MKRLLRLWCCCVQITTRAEERAGPAQHDPRDPRGPVSGIDGANRGVLAALWSGRATVASEAWGGSPPLVMYVMVSVAGFGAATAQNLLNDRIAGCYPPDARATGLGWALGVGRVGAIAGPAYGGALVALAALGPLHSPSGSRRSSPES